MKRIEIQQIENQTALDIISHQIKKNRDENKQTNIEIEI